LDAEMVSAEFHARFDAVSRTYLYRLIDRRPKLALDKGRIWRLPVKLDADLMHHAAGNLLGEHDFTTFRSTSCQAESPIKTLDELRIEAFDIPYGQEFHFHIRARSFLHNQVRSFIGTLERVGSGSWAPEDVRTALAARDRTACGPVSPPQGLYLTHVDYPELPFGA